MNNTTQTPQLDIFQESFDLLPEEARDFILSDTYSKAVKEICSLLSLEEERISLEKAILLFLVGEYSIEDLAESIATLSADDSTKNNILLNIKEKIVDELLLTIEVVSELEDKNSSPDISEKVQNAPSPTQVLESLKSRLTQTSTIAPIARDHTLTKQPPQTPEEKPSVDPYRELPQ